MNFNYFAGFRRFDGRINDLKRGKSLLSGAAWGAGSSGAQIDEMQYFRFHRIVWLDAEYFLLEWVSPAIFFVFVGWVMIEGHGRESE